MENRSFYNEILTEHNLHPEFKHDLPDADIVLEGVNPSCGDDIFLRQHRTIASASLSRLFAPLPQFRKWEIHTVFLHFRNFELEQKSCLRLLAELCGAALIRK